MEIKNIYGEVIYEDSSRSQREVLQNAVRNGVCLDFADLRGWDLSRIILTGVSFKYANMYKINLQGVHIYESSLYGAYIKMGDFRGGEFYEVNFRKVNLQSALLHGADLTGSTGIYQFGPIGELARIGHAVDWGRKVMFQLGCFWGDRKEATEKIRGKYGDNSVYERQVLLAAEAVKKGVPKNESRYLYKNL